MATINDITGDPLISKANNKAFEDNFDRIFRKKKPQSLDAAYERKAMEEGLVKDPVFPENKGLNEYPDHEIKEHLDW